MPQTEIEVRIGWKGLDPSDIDDLHDFLKSQESVARIHPRIFFIDAALDPSTVVRPAVIVGLVLIIDIGREAGKRGLDIAQDFVKEWLRRKCFPDTKDPIVQLYGPNGDIVSEVRKPSSKINK